jgi:hypothetical protein
LLLATATAFAVTQRLKLEPSPISQTHVDKVFSPVCECATHSAKIEFVIRRADHLRIVVPIGAYQLAVADREFPRGRVAVRWSGLDRVGDPVPDGVYHAVVHMRHARRTIDLPNPIQVDTQPPTIALTGTRRDGGKTIFTYRTSEPAHALLFVNGRRRVLTYSTRRHGRLPYYGKLSAKTRLVLAAEDLAGNRSAPVRISY